MTQSPRRSAIAIALAGLVALAVAMGIGRFAFTPLLPMMQDDAGVSLAQGGYLAAANYVGYLAGALWAMRPARRDLAIRGALLAIALTTLGMGYAHGMLAWTLLRALAGMASAWALVHVSSWCLQELAAQGFTEVYNYSFVSEEEVRAFGFDQRSPSPLRHARARKFASSLVALRRLDQAAHGPQRCEVPLRDRHGLPEMIQRIPPHAQLRHRLQGQLP